MRRVNFLGAALALLLVLPLNACHDANAEVAPRSLTVNVVRHAGTAWVVGSWKNATITDGKGALTNVLTYLKDGSDSTGHTLSATATKDSFQLTTAVGVTQSGQFCVVAKRRLLMAPANCKSWSVTESDSPPPGSTLDSVWVKQAMLDSKLVDTALIALTTGEVCSAEIRDYHQAMLLAPRGEQSENCQTVFDEDVYRDNMRTLTVLAAGYPWTATQDSIWRADTATRVTLPLVRVSTRWFPNPMSGDTLVFGGGTDNNVSIQTYRSRHPGFTWSSGT